MNHQVHRDGVPISPVFTGPKSQDTAWVWILKHQGQSVDWAMKYEGYSIEEVN